MFEGMIECTRRFLIISMYFGHREVHESLIPGKLILSIAGGDGQATTASMPEKRGLSWQVRGRAGELSRALEEATNLWGKDRSNSIGANAVAEPAYWIQSILPLPQY